jgi:HEAT repeat protein
LIAAIPAAGAACGPALAEEAGRRRLIAAVPALEELCRRFSGFGLGRAVPEQVAALEALAAIGSRTAAAAVARVIAKGAVHGPALKVALAAAARLGSDLPRDIVIALTRDPDPEVRADACRCVRGWPQAIPALLDLVHDPDAEVNAAAACALGRLGRQQVQGALVRLLRQAPTLEVIEALTPIADEDSVILLARIARNVPDLAEAALDALDAVDHPRAAQLLADLARRR